MKINNDEELKAALAKVSPMFDAPAEPEPGSAEEAYFLEILCAIEEYENKLWQAMPGPDLPPW